MRERFATDGSECCHATVSDPAKIPVSDGSAGVGLRTPRHDNRGFSAAGSHSEVGVPSS